MSGPPKDVKPSALFLKLTESPRPGEEIDIPRYDESGDPIARVWIQVLSMEEHGRAQVMAHERLKKRGFKPDDLESITLREFAGDAVAKELLAMAVLDAADHSGSLGGDKPIRTRIFRNGADVEKLPSDEVAFLFNAYITVQHKYGPFEKTIESDDDLNEWIKRLGEGASEFPLLRLPLPQLVELTSLLARRAYTLSQVLDSQWSGLPDTSKSLLEKCSMGTGFYGSPAASTTAESSDGGETGDPFAEMTSDEAREIAERMKRGE